MDARTLLPTGRISSISRSLPRVSHALSRSTEERNAPGSTSSFSRNAFGCFIPFQMVLIPMARMLGLVGLAGTVPGLIFVHLVYGIGFSTLYFKNYYQQFPTELVRAAQIDGAEFFTIFRRIMLPSSGPIAAVR